MKQRNDLFRRRLIVASAVMAASIVGGRDARVWAQSQVLIEDFEFARTDAAAAAGVTDITDFANQPTFYSSCRGQDASQGLYSLGVDALFCSQFCQPGSRVGFRRPIDSARFPATCPNDGHFVPLTHTYGDPAHPGPAAPDAPLSSLQVLCDAFGDGSFDSGLTGTHFWVTLADCEGEKFDFINRSEPALYSGDYTFDVSMGRDIVRLAPDSLTAVPDGDRLLTEIAAIEVLVQDEDNPPTSFGSWYIDNLRIIEPPVGVSGDWDGDGDVDLFDFRGLAACLGLSGMPASPLCLPLDFDDDGDVDLADAGAFQNAF